jgi:formylglycine-generating enzyme required for sulfatase activity
VTFLDERVKACDLFIGIVGHRFGDGPEGSQESFTQREYRMACENGRPRLLFMAPEDFPVPANLKEPPWKGEAQDEFRRKLLDSKERIVSVGFASTHELASQVTAGIYNLFFEQPRRAKADFTRYLTALWEDTRHIDIRGLRTSGGAVYQFDIDAIYTPLTTVLAHEADDEEAVPLQAALEKRRLVLVGDPGAGKSTFLRRIAFAACETLLGKNPLAAEELIPQKPCPVPLYISAASLANHIQKHLRDSTSPADAHSPEWLSHYLGELDADLDGGFILLLDGLDEVSDLARRKNIAKLLESAARTYAKTPIVATSRPPAYGGETVIPGFATVQIRPLEPAAVETFVEKWCRALYPAEETAKKHQTELLEEIRSRPEIQRMAVNPVMLTALAALHWNQKCLPDQRSELYESVLKWLAESREAQTGRSAVQCLAMMEYLAYTMHTDAKGKQVEITRHAAARILAPRFREVEEEHERIASAERFLAGEETDSGILISRGNTVKYWHLTFQEYLTAKALSVRDAERRRLLFEEGRLYSPGWRETALLLAGVLCGQDAERVDAFLGEILDQLGDQTTLTDRAKCVGLIGRILRDLKSWNYRIADKRYQENLSRCLAIFEKAQVREIDLATRLDAADAIGQAGDPRLDGDNWVRLEGGSFWMGAQKTDPDGKNYDPEAFDNESPVRLETVATFWMGRYPVTVQEYAGFVEAGGYGKEEFWSAGGFGEFSEPGYWRQQLQHPNRPVVRVGWYEAAAYCVWNQSRLPSDAEWEYAARGGREETRYPWGNEPPDNFRANVGGSPSEVVPVGMYPEGATPSGVQDLAGNVWELIGSGDVRGGSWVGPPAVLRVSSHGKLGRGGIVGFRCVRDKSA